MKNKIVFTIEEFKKLVINAYETGYCDGLDSTNIFDGSNFCEYSNAEDFWNKNKKNWLNNKAKFSE